jgi:hypothetical protein
MKNGLGALTLKKQTTVGSRSSPLVSSVLLPLLHSFRVKFYFYSTRFECSCSSSPLVSSVVLRLFHSFRVYFSSFFGVFKNDMKEGDGVGLFYDGNIFKETWREGKCIEKSWIFDSCKTTLETSGEDVGNTLETSGEDVGNTLE